VANNESTSKLWSDNMKIYIIWKYNLKVSFLICSPMGFTYRTTFCDFTFDSKTNLFFNFSIITAENYLTIHYGYSISLNKTPIIQSQTWADDIILDTFSAKFTGWANIWRNIVDVNHVNNASSSLFPNMLSSLADDTAKNQKWRIWGWMSLRRKDFSHNF
jgi:hypothetical protein